MFKIPSYDELEKKEKELRKECNNFTGSLFQKRKLLESDDENEVEKETSPPLKVVKSPPKKNETEHLNDDGDEDELLNMFINENKEIIEKPVVKNIENPSKQVENEVKSKPIESVFKIPEVIFKKPEPPPTTTSSTNYSSSIGSALIVSSKQRGNPMLKHVRNVPWKYCDQLTPDFQMSRAACGFFLSMKYHLLNPTYIHKRIKELGKAYELRVLLCLVDVKEPRHCIKELEKISIFASLTMILCWSNEEMARYLETYKAYELKSAEAIMEKASNSTNSTANSSTSNSINSDSSFVNAVTDFLCQIKSINKTDASTLRQTFGSVKQLSSASKDELNLCPGLGPLKVNRLHEIFRTPFLMKKPNT